MRLILFIFIFISSTLIGQTLTDIAASQNITVAYSTVGHLGNGMTFYDFDGDGWDDLTFPVKNDSILFYKNNNGVFTQLPSYLYAIDQVREILWVDYDDDDDLDLCVSYHYLGIRLYENDGWFNFNDVTFASGISTIPSLTYGFSFADPDSDGDLDLYVCSYESPGFVQAPTTNRLYENLGDGTFQEVAALSGVDNGLKLTFMAVWFDYDNDDLIDLHVVNDRASFIDGLYKNTGNLPLEFTDVAVTEGIHNSGHFPMTSSVSDFDNDGFQDVFVSDISNGNPFFHFELFKNQNGGNFIDVSSTFNIDTSVYAWGALWVDYNNDGYEDLYVATSFIDTVFSPTAESFLYRNEAGAGFTLINDSIIGNLVKSSYCPVKGDINNDGFYDIVVLNDGAAPNVLLNSADNGNNYIKVIPQGTVSNSRAIGAKVKVYSAGLNQYQTVFCGSGLCAQNSNQKIFGIGNNSVVDSLEVIFPSGIIVKKYDLAANQDYIIPEQLIGVVDIIQNVDTLTLCQGDSVSIGIPGYTNYLWNTGATNSHITVSTVGNYQFEAINLAGDSIIQSTILHVTYESAPIYQELLTEPICGVGNYGEIEIVFSSPQDTINNVITWADGSQGISLDSILPGSYLYTITSANNCVYQDNFVVSEVLPFSVVFISTPATDNEGGTVQFDTFGGVAPFSFILAGTTMSSFIDSLAPGTYTIDVVDANNCVVTVDFTIPDNSTNSLESEQLMNVDAYYSEQRVWLCSEYLDDIVNISLIDISGREVELEEWRAISDRCIASPTSLSQGIYHIRIDTKNSETSKVMFVR